MENSIIIDNGELVSLSDYQIQYDLKPDKLSENFSINEKKIGEFQPFKYAEPLIRLLQEIRNEKGSPIKINSGFRTREKQKQLIASGARAATFSPHEQGMAFDIDTVSYEDTLDMVKRIRAAADKLGIKVRIGYKQYWNLDRSTFVHVDVCPMYFGKGMPYHDQNHPLQWENEITW